MKRAYLMWVLIILYVEAGVSQPPSTRLQNHIYTELSPIRDPERINRLQKFYSYFSFHPVWITEKFESSRNLLFQMFRNASNQALDEKDYFTDFIQEFIDRRVPLFTAADSIIAEIQITDLALSYFDAIAYGKRPILSYHGLSYCRNCLDIDSLLAWHLIHDSLNQLPELLNSSLPEILPMLHKINWYDSLLGISGYTEVKISSQKVDEYNIPLRKKLYGLGVLDSINDKLSNYEIKKKLMEVQRQLNILADGTLRTTALEELNLPLSARRKQLKVAVNYYRWLACQARANTIIVVNIPAAGLKVYADSSVILEMRIISGKASTPTPTLSSTVTEVVLYPYWMVPRSIATKELLPFIKKNPGYLSSNNFQVINDDGKIVDPYEVNWHSLSPGFFPYTLRQSTGCDNALGIIKLSFYNPFNVYLHDTPGKSLFMIHKRYFSHGCIRMEKPREVAHLVLKDHPRAIDTLREDLCNTVPQVLPADQLMPVIVWYNPAGLDNKGRVIFYQDIYKKFNWSKIN